MPTLADIYSAIGSAKRKGSDFIQNPGLSLQQMVGLANDRAGVFNQAGSGALDEFLQTKSLTGPKQMEVAQTMADAYNPIGMTVFHGSPHIFEKFDLSKIGTGEGAQAYGKGMYMAQASDVAEEYAKKLGTQQINLGNKFYSLTPDGNNWVDSLGNFLPNGSQKMTALNRINNANNDPKKAVDVTNSWLSKAKIEKNIEDANYESEVLNLLQSAKLGKTGNLYKVDLPDTHIRRMLDWDAPLKEQPAPVRKLAKSLGLDMNDLGGDLLARVGKDEAGRKVLQDAGIRGVKYLDAQSRDATKGTRNFVVFDPNHLSILERNSQPIK